MWEPGKAAEVGFGESNGAAGQGAVFAEGNGSEWGSATGSAVSAAGEGTADRTAAAGGGTDGGVNFAASVALGPGGSGMVMLKSSTWAGSLHRCTGEGLPRGSEVPLKTNPTEAPGRIQR